MKSGPQRTNTRCNSLASVVAGLTIREHFGKTYGRDMCGTNDMSRSDQRIANAIRSRVKKASGEDPHHVYTAYTVARIDTP